MRTDDEDLIDPEGDVSITLSRDERLVLFEFLSRGLEAGNDYSRIEDQAELRVLWDLLACLEPTLIAMFMDNYDDLLEGARAAVRDPIE